MSLNQSFISDFSEYYRWSQRTKIHEKVRTRIKFSVGRQKEQWFFVKVTVKVLLLTLGRNLNFSRHFPFGNSNINWTVWTLRLWGKKYMGLNLFWPVLLGKSEN